MKFDNTQTAIKIQMQKRLLAVVVAVVVALLYTTSVWDYVQEEIGLSRLGFTLIVLFLFILFYIYHILVASSFIYYSDDEPKIIIRFYQLNFFNSAKNSFEIPKKEFTGFRIERSVFNLREDLIMFRKSQGKIVRYPPFSISSLSLSEKGKLLKSLNSFSQKQFEQ
jgi:Na+-transporting methylmalonyl-CoA/oxaloacetate decarboxylase gamma subunit